jgi:hypothetical protein
MTQFIKTDCAGFHAIGKKGSFGCDSTWETATRLSGMQRQESSSISNGTPLTTYDNSEHKKQNPDVKMQVFEFVWPHGGDQVILTGNFDDWKATHYMTKNLDSGIWETHITLDRTRKIIFKFVVDGIWRCSLDFPTEEDDHHNVNNVIFPEDVAAYISRLSSECESLSSSRSASPLERSLSPIAPLTTPFSYNSSRRKSSSPFSGMTTPMTRSTGLSRPTDAFALFYDNDFVILDALLELK